MFRLTLVAFLCVFQVLNALGQESDSLSYKEKAYQLMVDKLLSHSVPELKVGDDWSDHVVYLDAREKSEYDVSHIQGALYVGYDDFRLSRVKKLPKDVQLIVYCSVGYRSEKVAEKLRKSGYTNAYNLVGGIFEWHNKGYSVVDKSLLPTNKVHGYDKLWGKWLERADVVYSP